MIWGRVRVFGTFQFTPLREGRHNTAGNTLRQHYFNSRPSARGDLNPQNRNITPSGFQFTPLREGRLRLYVAKFGCQLFQFTPLREGRPES